VTTKPTLRVRLGALHAVVSGIPLGLFVGGSLFDIASRISSEPAGYSRHALWLFVAGAVMAVVAGIPGLLLLPVFEATSVRAALGRRHVLITDAGLVVGIGSILLRWRGDAAGAVPTVPLLLGLVATGSILAGGWLAATTRMSRADD